MADYRIVRAKPEHVTSIIPDLRPEDVTEWLEAARRLNLNSQGDSLMPWLLKDAVRHSEETARALVPLDGGVPLCLWGAVPTDVPAFGRCWLVGTREGQRKAFHVQRFFREGVALLHGKYRFLEAHVDAVNYVHVGWLHKLGWEDVGPSNVIPGERFRLMIREAR